VRAQDAVPFAMVTISAGKTQAKRYARPASGKIAHRCRSFRFLTDAFNDRSA
jgi:hypothetical protein